MDEKVFSDHVRDMERRLYRVAYAILGRDADCADAVQEALVRAWIARKSLRQERYFETWLTRILINECRRLLKKRRKAPAELPDNAASPPPADPALALALTRLAERERLCLTLHHAEGYSVAEIADMLRVPQGTVKSRLSRGRKQLKDALNKEGWV